MKICARGSTHDSSPDVNGRISDGMEGCFSSRERRKCLVSKGGVNDRRRLGLLFVGAANDGDKAVLPTSYHGVSPVPH